MKFRSSLILVLSAIALFSIRAIAIEIPMTDVKTLHPSQEVSFEEARNAPESEWKDTPLRIDLSTFSHWNRIRYTPTTTGTQILSIFDNYSISNADFYVRNNNGTGYRVDKNGASVRGIDRSLATRNHAFAFETKSGEPIEVYVRTLGPVSFRANFRVETPNEYSVQNSTTLLIIGINIGCLLIGVLSIFLIAGSFQNSKLTTYSFFGFSMIFGLVSIYGLWSYFIGNMGPITGTILGFWGTILPQLGGLFFCRSFLETKRISPQLNKTIWFMIFVTVSMGILRTAFPWNPLIEELSRAQLNAINFIVYLTAGVIAYRARVQFAGYYIVAWTIFFVGVIIYYCGLLGVVRQNYITDFAPPAAQLVEFFILNVAILKMFRTYNAARNESDHLKNLLRVISHDLSNPLNVVTIGIERLQTKISQIENNEELQGTLKRIDQGISRLQIILAELREYLHLQTSPSAQHQALDAVPLKEIFVHLNSEFQERLQQKNQQLIFEGDWHADLKILAIKEPLCRSILGNLISNACKFSRKDSKIFIRSSVVQNVVTIEVADSGMGMDQKIADTHFAGLPHESTLGTDGERGTGFGIMILVSYLQQWGIASTVESKIGVGTKIRLEFKKA